MNKKINDKYINPAIDNTKINSIQILRNKNALRRTITRANINPASVILANVIHGNSDFTDFFSLENENKNIRKNEIDVEIAAPSIPIRGIKIKLPIKFIIAVVIVVFATNFGWPNPVNIEKFILDSTINIAPTDKILRAYTAPRYASPKRSERTILGNKNKTIAEGNMIMYKYL